MVPPCSRCIQVSGLLPVKPAIVWREHPTDASGEACFSETPKQAIFEVVLNVSEVLILHVVKDSGSKGQPALHELVIVSVEQHLLSATRFQGDAPGPEPDGVLATRG